MICSRVKNCQRSRLAFDRGRDDLAIDALRVGMGFQLAPAGKAIVPGDVELGLMQPRLRIAGTQLLCRRLAIFFSQSRSGWEGSVLVMQHLLSQAPGVRWFGQERRCGTHLYGRRVQPFTRTVGRLLDRAAIIGEPRRRVKSTGIDPEFAPIADVSYAEEKVGTLRSHSSTT